MSINRNINTLLNNEFKNHDYLPQRLLLEDLDIGAFEFIKSLNISEDDENGNNIVVPFQFLAPKIGAVDEGRTHDLFPTKEVLYHWATTANILSAVSLASFSSERKTGLEPATLSLEGWCSTKWATSAYCLLLTFE